MNVRLNTSGTAAHHKRLSHEGHLIRDKTCTDKVGWYSCKGSGREEWREEWREGGREVERGKKEGEGEESA